MPSNGSSARKARTIFRHLINSPDWRKGLIHKMKCMTKDQRSVITLKLAKFLVLRAAHPDLHPTYEMDKAWHLLMLTPKLNQAVCKRHFKCDFLPHTYEPLITDPDEVAAAAQRLNDLWTSTFAEPAPAEPAPGAEAAPAESAPAEPAPAESAPAESLTVTIRVRGGIDGNLDKTLLTAKTSTLSRIEQAIRNLFDPNRNLRILCDGLEFSSIPDEFKTLGMYLKDRNILSVWLSPRMSGC